jgi:glutathione S-transferase
MHNILILCEPKPTKLLTISGHLHQNTKDSKTTTMTSLNIELLTAATPNGQKISIFLEELGIPYKTSSIDLGKDEQKSSSFLKTNPNGRIPAIIDHSRNSFPVFESGAIFLYLAEHYDKSFKFSFEDADERSECLQWLFFQNAGLGPMQGYGPWCMKCI